MKDLIVVIEGPSGVGKDSIIFGLIKKHPNKYEKIVSVTTREMREYESQGNPYLFVDDRQFEQMYKSGDVFEFTTRHNTKRGMSEKLIREIFSKEKVALKDVDIIGIEALKKKFKNVVTIFIYADKSEVERRIRKRGGDEEDIKTRLDDFDVQMKNKKYFDYFVENYDLQKAIDDIEDIITKCLQC